MLTQAPETPVDPAAAAGPAATVAPSAPSGIGDRFVDAVKDPAVLELIIVSAIIVLLLLFFRRMGRVARELSKRKELREYVRGLSALVNGDYGEAVKLLERVVERDPEHTDARIALGDAYFSLGDFAEAHRHHYHVERVFGKPSTRVSLCLGKDLAALGRGEEAVDHLELASRGEVEGPTARALLVKLLAELGREREAIPLVAGPADETRAQLGRLHAAAGFRALSGGQEKEAAKHLTRALDQNPGLLAPRMALVGRKWLTGDVNGAWSDFHRHLNEVHSLASSGVVLETGAPESGLSAALEGNGAGGFSGDLDSFSDGPQLGPYAAPTGQLPPTRPMLPAGRPGEQTDRHMEYGPGDGVIDVIAEPAEPPAVEALSAVDPSSTPPTPMPEDLGEMVGAVIRQRARYRCDACGTAAVRFSDRCETCGVFGKLHSVRAAVGRLTEDVSDVVDEIEENRHYVGRLLERIVGGDEEAEARLLRVGPGAIPEVFQRMMEVADNEPLVRYLIRVGPEHLPLMVDAYLHMRTFGSRNILREGLGIFRSFDGVLAALFTALGSDAMKYLERSLNHPDETVRRLSLKAIVDLGRGDVLETVSHTVPRRDVMLELNDASDTSLLEVLRQAPAGPSAVVRLLSERTFERETLLARALDDEMARDTAAEVIGRRGFSQTMADGLLERLREPTLAIAARLLRGFGVDALDHLVQSYAKPHLDRHRREAVATILVEHESKTAWKLVEQLPLEDDDDLGALVTLFRSIGEPALPALEDRYAKSSSSIGGLLKMGFGLGGGEKAGPLKADLLNIAAAIGGLQAKNMLRRLAAAENNAECLRLIENLLREMGRAEREDG